MNAIKSWGIIGGGILGMSLALQLAQDGYDVTLFEAESSFGGLTSPYLGPDLTWDRYYHVILQTDSLIQSLLRDLDLEDDIQWIKAKSGFYSEDGFTSMSNIWEFIRFPLLNFWNKLRLGLTILYASKIKNTKKLESQSLEEWLTKWSGKSSFYKIWLPLLRAKLGDAYKNTSASFIQSAISRMYSAREQNQKQEKFGYVPGSYATILPKFTQFLKDKGIKIKRSYPVKTVKMAENNLLAVSGLNGKGEIFDRVILTIPSPLVASLCPELSTDEKTRLSRTPYMGIICASFLVKDPLSGFYITNIVDGQIPFTAVIEMTALMNRDTFQGHSLVYLPKYVTSSDPLFEISDKELEQHFIQGFLKMYPRLRPKDITCFRVARNRFVFSPPQQNKDVPSASFVTSVPGIFTVNSSYISEGTLCVNEILALSRRALDKIL